MDVAAAAAWQAGKVTLRYFQTPVTVETKPDKSPVTIADRESETLILEIIHREFPDDGFLGEEHGEYRGTSGYRWIVDPIDGTKSFVRGVPLYGVMIALTDPDGEAVTGAICFPPLGDLIVAARGEGCYWNGRRARVSDVSTLSESCVVYTGPESFAKAGIVPVLEKLYPRVGVLRTWGDCYGHMLVATGRAEAMLDPVLEDWDAAALLPVIEEAGGTFTDWTGERTVFGKSGISTNGRIDEELKRVFI
jgi:histidinol phosphatase-like enzyme (inositol monophosphatase family)